MGNALIRRYLDVLDEPTYTDKVKCLDKVYEIRAGRAGSEIVCGVYLNGEYLDAFSFMAAEIEPSRGVGEEVLAQALMDNAKTRLTGNLTFR